MGLFEKMEEWIEGSDAELMASGQLGRAIIQSVSVRGMTLQRGGAAMPPDQKCQFTLTVYLDDTPPFTAQAVKMVPQYAIDKFVPGQSVVAVRVDPANHSRVALDLATPPPSVRLTAGGGNLSAASILATGTPCRAIIVGYEPEGVKNPNGIDIYCFTLTIMAEGRPPYQVVVGNPAPPEALPVMYPGSKVPAKFDPNGPEGAVAIDWPAALAESAR